MNSRSSLLLCAAVALIGAGTLTGCSDNTDSGDSERTNFVAPGPAAQDSSSPGATEDPVELAAYRALRDYYGAVNTVDWGTRQRVICTMSTAEDQAIAELTANEEQGKNAVTYDLDSLAIDDVEPGNNGKSTVTYSVSARQGNGPIGQMPGQKISFSYGGGCISWFIGRDIE